MRFDKSLCQALLHALIVTDPRFKTLSHDATFLLDELIKRYEIANILSTVSNCKVTY